MKKGNEYHFILSCDEFSSYKLKEGSFELIPVKNNIWVLLPAEEGSRKKMGRKEPTPEELSLLKKLDTIKYEKRLPPHVDKLLSPEERELIDKMLKKGLLRIYKGGKYASTGVYDIPRSVYALLRRSRAEPEEKLMEKEGISWDAHLHKYGYVVIADENEAKAVSRQLERQIKGGTILGIRGFDKTFYIAHTNFYNKWVKRIRPLLKEERTHQEVARKLGMSEIACRVMLELMREHGEVIEKRRGLYKLA